MNTTDNYQKYASKNSFQKFLIENFYKALLRLIVDLKIETILDAGCGEGFTLERLRKEGLGKRLEGVDRSSAAIALGKKMAPGLILRFGDINTLPYQDSCFDLVVCSEVLEHLARPEEALKEIKRVAKKYCLLSVPNEPFFMAANLLRGKNLLRWGNDIEHVNHWSHKDFKKFLEGRGWKILAIKIPFPWTLVLAEKNFV